MRLFVEDIFTDRFPRTMAGGAIKALCLENFILGVYRSFSQPYTSPYEPESYIQNFPYYKLFILLGASCGLIGELIFLRDEPATITRHI